MLRQQSALIKFYFNIPYPEELSDEDWVENCRQLEYLADKGILGIKRRSNDQNPT